MEHPGQSYADGVNRVDVIQTIMSVARQENLLSLLGV